MAAAAETVAAVVVAVIDPGRWPVNSNGERFDIRLSSHLPHPAVRTAT